LILGFISLQLGTRILEQLSPIEKMNRNNESKIRIEKTNERKTNRKSMLVIRIDRLSIVDS